MSVQLRSSTTSPKHPLFIKPINTSASPAIKARSHTHTSADNDSANGHDTKRKSWWRWFVEDVGMLNVLLLAGPPAVILRILGVSPTSQFFFACMAIVPLAGWLGDATEHLSEHLGSGTGGLLNATFGNAAELIIASFSVFRGLDVLVKSSLVGSIIGNLLLVLGASILCGGIKYQSQSFSINAANIDANMSVVAAIGFLVPSMFHHFNAAKDKDSNGVEVGPAASHEHALSLGISAIFLATYIFMLFFQLKTHSHYFNDPHGDADNDNVSARLSVSAVPSETSALLANAGRAGSMVNLNQSQQQPRAKLNSFHIPRSSRRALSRVNSVRDGSRTPIRIGGVGDSADHTPTSGSTTPSYERVARALDRQRNNNISNDEYGATLVDVYEEKDDEIIVPGIDVIDKSKANGGEHDTWSMKKAFGVLTLATLCVVVLSEILTGAVEVAAKSLQLNELFVGVIIVAIVGNAAEHFTAVLSALHNDMDIAISIAFGSALQISMFVMPVIVLLSYARSSDIGPMDITLSEFEVFGVTCATVISWMVVVDGASTWLEGLMLLVIYSIIGLAFYYAGD